MSLRDQVATFDRRGADTGHDPDAHHAADPHDPAAEEVRHAWETLPSSLFGSEDERTRARETLAGVGLFGALAGARRAGQRIDALAAVALSTPAVRALKGHRAIIEAWIAPLRQFAARPAEDLDEEAESEPEPDGAARLVSFDRIRAQRDAIVGAMRQQNLGRARQMIEELCAYQRRGKPIYLAKSLCHLAADAQRLGLHQLQDELTDRATRACPDDPWAWSQRGTALRRVGKLSEALRAYDRALVLGGDAAAKNGRADALRAMGRHDEALRAYEQTAVEHPDNVYAVHGRTEVLKALGRLDEAFVAYDAMLDEDAGDVFAKAGRAAVFKMQGRHDEALRAYDAAVREHPDNAVLKSGRAEVLKALGRLDDALRAYDDVGRNHPGSVVAKSGRAELLKDMGRLDEALDAYDTILREYPTEIVPKNARAEVLRSLGRHQDALEAYDAALREHPESVVAKSGRAMVLRWLGRYDDALGAYDAALRENPANLVLRTGRAEILKLQGRFDEALVTYDAILRDHPTNDAAKIGRARIWKTEGRIDEALQVYEAILAEQPGARPAQRGRADVLRAAGRLDDALRAYGAILHDHPADLVAVIGCACTLALLGKSREALRALPHGPPAIESHWIAYHARGLILLRARKVDEATRALEDGLQRDPVLFRRDAYRVAMAVALLWQRRPAEALALLAEVRELRFQPQVDMLRVHAFGAQGRLGEARAAYYLFPLAAGGAVRDLIQELRRRFVDQAPAEHDDEWLIRREIEACLRTA